MAAAECREESGGALGIISKRSGAVANRIPAPEPQNQQISRQPVTKKSTNEGVDCNGRDQKQVNQTDYVHGTKTSVSVLPQCMPEPQA